MKATSLLASLVLAAAVAFAHAPALVSELVWDDQVLVQYQLPHFRSLDDVLQPPEHIARWSYGYYRPVVVLSHLADRALFGPAASAGPHAANVLIHLLVTLLGWRLIARLLGARPHAEAAALTGAMAFAVHPIHAESVNWIAGRSDLLCALLVLAALLLALRWRDRGSPVALGLSAVGFACAMLAKEHAVTGVALLPLLWVLVPRDPHGRREMREAAAAAWAAALWLLALILWWWLRWRAGVAPPGTRELGGSEPIARALQAVSFYARKLVVPWPQSAIITPEMLPGRAASALVLAAATALTAIGAWRWRRGRDHALLAATGWFWITVSVPVWIAAMAVTNTPLAERYLYLPSVGAAIGAGATAAWALGSGGPRLPRATLGLVLAGLAAASLQRGLVMRSSLALWSDTVDRAPGEGLPWENLGLAYWRTGQTGPALAAFRRAIAIPDYEARGRARAHNAIGAILAAGGDPDAAIPEFRRAVALNPAYAEAWYGLAAAYQARAAHLHAAGETRARDEAADMADHFYRTALERYSGYHPARLGRAAALGKRASWLAAEGRAQDSAAFRAEALRLLDDLALRLATEGQQDPLARLSTEVGVDAEALRRQLQGG